MDPAMLAASVTSLLAPYLAKAGDAILTRAAEALPDAAARLWNTVMHRFEGNPAADGAAKDLTGDASDPDRQAAFTLQLKMALKDDPEFASALADMVRQLQSSDAAKIAHIDIKTGDVSGSAFVIGDNNEVKSG